MRLGLKNDGQGDYSILPRGLRSMAGGIVIWPNCKLPPLLEELHLSGWDPTDKTLHWSAFLPAGLTSLAVSKNVLLQIKASHLELLPRSLTSLNLNCNELDWNGVIERESALAMSGESVWPPNLTRLLLSANTPFSALPPAPSQVEASRNRLRVRGGYINAH